LAGPDGITGPIAEDLLVDVLSRTQAVNDGDDITQFEITTAAAMLAFAEHAADVLLLEVGLGGRLDATNVVEKPVLTVLTPISCDHADRLGSTMELIAAEKAGILKPGVPCIVSQQDDLVHEVIAREAARLDARLVVWGSA